MWFKEIIVGVSIFFFSKFLKRTEGEIAFGKKSDIKGTVSRDFLPFFLSAFTEPVKVTVFQKIGHR
jgi:hypothetical protein